MTRAGSLASQLTARYFAETSTVAWMHKHTYLMTTDTRFCSANIKARHWKWPWASIIYYCSSPFGRFPTFPQVSCLKYCIVIVFPISATWYNRLQPPCFNYSMCVYHNVHERRQAVHVVYPLTLTQFSTWHRCILSILFTSNRDSMCFPINLGNLLAAKD